MTRGMVFVSSLAAGGRRYGKPTVFPLVMANPRAKAETCKLAGSHTYRDPDLARFIVQATGSQSEIELVDDSTEGMISVSVERLRRLLSYEPERGEFLTGLIRRALKEI
ncbi:MAG: hypothetical protein R6X31_15340 [Anaerolineae bacterium]